MFGNPCVDIDKGAIYGVSFCMLILVAHFVFPMRMLAGKGEGGAAGAGDGTRRERRSGHDARGARAREPKSTV